jgi:hypothetical protein
MSLADLVVPGASFDAGNGVTYSDFDVQIKGKGLSKDLSDYQVVSTADGFELTGDFNTQGENGKKKKGGKIKMSYDVTASSLVGAAVAIEADTGSRGKVKVWQRLFDDKKVDKLKASLKRPSDTSEFGDRTTLSVREAIAIKGDYFDDESDSSIDHSFTGSHVPEPTTALMLAAGLAGLAAARRRRSC